MTPEQNAATNTDAVTIKPLLRIEGLKLRDCGAIQNLTLPDDGLGWKGKTPDIMMIGGVNGSGKTTLLELFYKFFSSLAEAFRHPHQFIGFELQFRLSSPEIIESENVEFTYTTPSNTNALLPPFSTVFPRERKSTIKNLCRVLLEPAKFSIPYLVYIPSSRELALPATAMKSAGKLKDNQAFAHRWTRANQWKDSLEALLYAARWEDLNAKEEGRPEEAKHFALYNEAVERFFSKQKSLLWHKGELFVEMANTGERHGLEALSSGEKQLLILVTELLRRWKPGSLILIDEPELHLHTSWQTRLYELICELQEERGGQVLIATQSNHLFQLGEPGTKLLLGGKTLA